MSLVSRTKLGPYEVLGWRSGWWEERKIRTFDCAGPPNRDYNSRQGVGALCILSPAGFRIRI